MGECTQCGKSDHLTRKCNHCGVEYCTEHTLPEKHDCPGLDRIGEDTKHLQTDISAKLSANQRKEKTVLSRVKDTVIPDSNSDTAQKTEQEVQTEEFSGDSSPDVASDGSLVYKDNELDEELDRIRRETAQSQNQRLRNGALSAKIWGKRIKGLFFDLRFWFVVVLLVATSGQLGYIDLSVFPI